ncbi:DNA internalization-related competence protein ComEC/Rec2 [Domibacillus indicus]|uniref:DNA internalization-related competence protein ComEC/Rec2 n=1 Tax=Domibacillus indicus TaxID=1437523 RepID=UPI00203C7F45|nr:DNA internalization-related competence protein ComEC/Rec2 [Domibacillus indicus]MCM3788489.1 DNA internalization-related competence protein ComEC/Rec2 [Domibacillus indicus]
MPLLQMSMAALAAILFAVQAPWQAALLAAAIGGLLCWKVDRRTRFWIIGTFMLFLSVVPIQEARSQSAFTGKETKWIVSFTDDIQIEGNRLRAGVEETQFHERLSLVYRMNSKEEKELLQEGLTPGLTCRVQGKASLPNEARNPGEFDYRSYLAASGTFFVLTPEHISLDQCVLNQSLRYVPAAWRMAAIKRIQERFPAPLAHTAAALLVGDRSSGPEETEGDYERLGIVHILSISGLHVTLLTGLLFYLLLRAGMTREWARLLLLTALPLYALLAGGSPPVVRSCLMTGAILLAAFNSRKLSAAGALGASFLIMTLWNPFLIFQAGFQLSFLVTFALVLSTGVILKKAQHAVELSLFVSVLSQLAALPVLLFHFAELSVISPLANLLFVPFYSFFMMPAVLLLFCLSFLTPISFFASFVNECLIKMDQLAALLANLPFAVFVTGQPGMEAAALLTVTSLASLLLWELRKNMKLSLAICSFALAVFVLAGRFSPEGKITFLDVGQGDSILIQLPRNEGNYLIDTGGQVPFEQEAWKERNGGFSVGKDTVVPFLKREGIAKLDKLIITHADFDHAGAAAEVLQSISAKEIIISPGSGEEPVIADMIKTGLKIREGGEGESWRTKSAVFQFLAPDDRDYEGNNDSLVLFARIGGKTWLFTGDLEKEGEAELIEKYSFHADWLKVGHHGSKTSSSPSFIQALQPQFAVISAGLNNRYGHPHKEVTDTLEKEGVRIYRTDKHGAITYTFKGENGKIETVLLSP